MKTRVLPLLLALVLSAGGCKSHSDSQTSGQKSQESPKPPPSSIGFKVVSSNPMPRPAQEARGDAAPPCPPEGTPLSEQKAAEDIWDAFQSIVWDEKPRGNCKEFQGDGSLKRLSEEWCFRCPECKPTHFEERFYYALSPDAEACGLEEIHFSVARDSDEWLDNVHNMLAETLEKTYGAGDSPNRVYEFGSGMWKNLKRWQTKDALVYLYIFNHRIFLRARHQHLVEALAVEKVPGSSRSLFEKDVEEPLDQKLGQSLQRDFPALPELLSMRDPKPEAASPVLLKMLTGVKEAPPELQPTILIACDRLADRVALSSGESSGGWLELKSKLEQYKLTFEWSHLGSCWVYQRELLKKVVEDYSGSPWAEDAFLLLMARGFQTGVGCREGPAAFRKVIKEGGAFLKRDLSPNARLQALFLLAEAYETWWSLSKASDKDEYVQAGEYKEGAEDARINSIRVYRLVRELAPKSPYADLAGLRLGRLKLKIDTNQRRFYCIYD